MKPHFRQTIVRIHRWLGLTMAAFLLLAGGTGAILAWNDQLDHWLNPELFYSPAPAPSAQPLDPLLLRQRVAQTFPDAQANTVALTQEAGRSAIFWLSGRIQADGTLTEPANNQVFVDPYSGRIQGARRWGDISQGKQNLLPFIYRLHYSLALGDWASTVFGIIALLWTVDCFAGAWLTLPAPVRKSASQARNTAKASGKSWRQRWAVSWKIRRGSGSYKLIFDWHRAASLWLWAMLLVLAWSSVSFNLPAVYKPVMQTLFASQPEPALQAAMRQDEHLPRLDWNAARTRGRALMTALAARKGFAILQEDDLSYDPARGLYSFSSRSSRDVSERWGSTVVYFDGDSGAERGAWLPTGEAGGDTIRSWLTSLHMAAVGGVPYQVFSMLLGCAVASLSISGVAIWWKKRQGRQKSARQGQGKRPTQQDVNMQNAEHG
ncbi:PepSY domain-containing protein [Aquitalea sp. LB_tupeE]|uniref:PepSY-associated TM helix domain-containing protein n=1 Tax=Aquitalea sp. LB_tupeE TaxID=2748078 RepID=UPI0015B88FB0|nr:PepSY-associated TM helix domain-containing protein [Aquitalea sp. LB_tupeE]NWK80027.1 PepSY domain-containing protein [Aquitalea sp. LB_tupeE]